MNENYKEDLKVYIVTEWDDFNKETIIRSVHYSAEEAKVRIEDLKGEAKEAKNHWLDYSFEEFEVW